MKYIISYDLNRPGQQYQQLWGALGALGAQRILLSQWLIARDGTNARAICDHLRQFVDQNDRLLVTSLDSSDWASWNLLTRVAA